MVYSVAVSNTLKVTGASTRSIVEGGTVRSARPSCSLVLVIRTLPFLKGDIAFFFTDFDGSEYGLGAKRFTGRSLAPSVERSI